MRLRRHLSRHSGPDASGDPRRTEWRRALGRELVEQFRGDATRHLATSEGAARGGLVTRRAAGRERYYQLNAVRLQEVYDWVGHYQRFWHGKLDALSAYLDRAMSGAFVSQSPIRTRRTVSGSPFTDPVALAAWLMPNDFQPVVGHRFTSSTSPRPASTASVHCEVLTVEPLHHLSFQLAWWSDRHHVSFSLEAVARGTQLTLEQLGFAGVAARSVGWMLGHGWRRMRARACHRCSTASGQG